MPRIADIDFETYSEAGYVWDADRNRWVSEAGAGKKGGLSAVGLQRYAEHPSTEVLSLAYDLRDGQGVRLWLPGMEPPVALFAHIRQGGLVAAWNSAFEERIWRLVCVPKLHWPELPAHQIRCDMARAKAFCLPPSLEKAGDALGLPDSEKKDAAGDRLLRRFSVPRSPTKKDSRLRLRPEADAEGVDLWRYNMQDVRAEQAIAARIPDLIPSELAFWQLDQKCNRTGTRVDIPLLGAMRDILDGLMGDACEELRNLTRGAVSAPSEVAKTIAWLAGQGVHLSSLDEDAVDEALSGELPPLARRALQIRADYGSASVKKVYAFLQYASKDGRVHDMFKWHSARTGRDAGEGVQPQNMVNSGPDVALCDCGGYFRPDAPRCPHCGEHRGSRPAEWNAVAMEQAISLILRRDIHAMRETFGSPVRAISGCLRGVFIADEGHDLIGTDFSSIEAVVAAALAGEEWRMEVFRKKGDIYLESVGRIKRTDVSVYKAHKEQTGMHHPDRKVGKIAELASGFGGWVGAWRAFGAEEALGSEQAIKQAIVEWRKQSPAIVEMWGGQFRGMPWDENRRPEFYGLEGMAVRAVISPGQEFTYRQITYYCADDVLYCRLPSGRSITYHQPRLSAGRNGTLALSFMGWNTNPKMGPQGWVRLETFAGRLFENVVQAVARDILAHAVINLEAAGYDVLLRVHDELVVQVREGQGSVEDVERIVSQMPDWAADWPVRAAGGWRGKRYRK